MGKSLDDIARKSPLNVYVRDDTKHQNNYLKGLDPQVLSSRSKEIQSPGL